MEIKLKIKYSFLFLFCLLLSFNSFSIVKTWNTTTGGLWTTASNWLPLGSPATNDDIIVPLNQSAAITNVPSITLNSLTINGNCQLTGAGDPNTITITNSFYISTGALFTVGGAIHHVTFILNGIGVANGDILFHYNPGVVSFLTINGSLTINSVLSYSIESSAVSTPTMIIPSGATLIMGSTAKVTNANFIANFSLNLGGTLKIASIDGITTTGTLGNIQVTGTRTYKSGAKYEYNNQTSNQNTGNGFNQNTPATLTVNIAGANTLSLTANTSISVGLTLQSGLLSTNASSRLLTLLNGATAPALTAISTSYIDGPMLYQKSSNGTLNFPIGKFPDCRPMELTVNQTGSSGNIFNYLGETFNASARTLGWINPATIDTVSDMHYWDITRTNNVTGLYEPILNLTSATLKLHFGANDGVKDLSTLRVVKNTYTATNVWSDLYTGTTSGTITNGNVTPAPFTSFSRFTLAGTIGGVNPLPIELISFEGACQNNNLQLNWSTASETNNNYFLIERSKDAFNWEPIAKIKGANNSSIINKYEYTDYYQPKAIVYYRLSQVDMNNTKIVCEIIDINCEAETKNELVCYPNPFETELNLVITSTEAYSMVLVQLMDDLASVVFKTRIGLDKGINSFNFPIDIDSGLYILVIQANGLTILTHKVMVK